MFGMTTFARNITTLIIVAFAGLLAILIVASMNRAASPIEGTMASTLEEMPNLDMVAVAPADVYGDNYKGALFVCPGMTEEMLAELHAPEGSFDFVDGKIPEGINYIVPVDAAGNMYVERADRKDIDVCSTQQIQGGVDAFSMVPFARNGAGWVLVG